MNVFFKMIFQCLDFKRETPFFEKRIILFILSSFPSFPLGEKNQRGQKNNCSSHKWGRDAAQDLTKHFNISKFLIPHLETFPMLRWAWLPSLSPLPSASGTEVLECPPEFLGKSWGPFWVYCIFLRVFTAKVFSTWMGSTAIPGQPWEIGPGEKGILIFIFIF